MEKKQLKKVGKNILKGVIYLIIPIIIELLFSKKVILEKSTLIRLAMLYGIEILYFGYFIINKYKEKIKKGINFVINKRYIIIPIIFVVCILFKINLSSINIWNNFLNENNFTKNILSPKIIATFSLPINSSITFDSSDTSDESLKLDRL